MSSINQTFFFFTTNVYLRKLNTNTIYDIIGVATCAKETKCLGPKVNVCPVFTNRYLACYFNSLLGTFFLFFKKSRSVPYLGNFRQFRGEEVDCCAINLVSFI